MEFEKRVVVLKQLGKGFSADGSVLSGAVYAERLGKELSLKIQTAGLSPLKEGRYVGVFSAGEKEYCFSLGGGETIKIGNAPSIKQGFSVLVAFVRGQAQPVAYGVCGIGQKKADALLCVLSEDGKERLPDVPIPPVEVPLISPNTPDTPITPPVPGIPQESPLRELPAKEEPALAAGFRESASRYDDEAIAEADYFDDALRKSDGDDSSQSENEESERKKPCRKNSQKDEGGIHPFLRTAGKLTYYKKVKKSLEKAFARYPSDTRLLGVFPRSEWVRAESVLLGIVYENGVPRYLCVALEKAGDAPEEMREHCVFVPESPFSDEKGFYIVFQDADTGTYVQVEKN